MIAYGPADATTTPSSLASLNSMQIGLNYRVPAYPGCYGKEAAKRVSVCLVSER